MNTFRKWITVLAAAATVLLFGTGIAGADEADFFNPEVVHRIDIRLSAEDWEDLLAHPLNKTGYPADLLIDGEEIRHAAFSTKGTSSLIIPSAKPDNTRYSFQIRFNFFVQDQSWQGLRALQLLSSFADATYMKDLQNEEDRVDASHLSIKTMGIIEE